MRKLIFAIVAIAIAIVGAIVYNIGYYNSVDEMKITVTDKERITESNGVTSKYLVFTDKETFENTDALIFGKFNSSDIQGKLKVDSTYNIKVVGWRVPFMNTYRNIIEVY
jgi:hypothetical protein